jgi:hypothetical protein
VPAVVTITVDANTTTVTAVAASPASIASVVLGAPPVAGTP